MSTNFKKDFRVYVFVFVLGVVLTIATTFGLLQEPIKKMSMEGEVKAYKVVVMHGTSAKRRKVKKWKSTNILL